MKKVYILLTKSNTFCSKLIHTATKGNYTHASISLDADFEKMYSFARRYKHAMLPAGFIKESLYCGIMGDSDDMQCAVYELQVTNLTYLKLKTLIKNMEKEKKKYNYNLIGLLTCLFNKEIERKRNFFCSEFVYYALAESGAIVYETHRSLVKPMDLQRIEGAREVFSGEICNLRNKKIAV